MSQSVISEISLERWRQKTVEGWSVEHDDDHEGGEMAQAAACYADPSPDLILHANEIGNITFGVGRFIPKRWPWAVAWWKPKNRRRDLIRAAALIVAEIERLDRAQERASNAGLTRPASDDAKAQPAVTGSGQAPLLGANP